MGRSSQLTQYKAVEVHIVTKFRQKLDPYILMFCPEWQEMVVEMLNIVSCFELVGVRHQDETYCGRQIIPCLLTAGFLHLHLNHLVLARGTGRTTMDIGPRATLEF